MIGIEAIGVYFPPQKESNYNKKEKFSIDDHFIQEKIGVEYLTKKESDTPSSSMAIKAFAQLEKSISINKEEIDCVFLVTQNPDYKLPHTAAIVCHELGLPHSVASFDISLGCSGYVYGLNAITSFMQFNGMKKGLLFTSDQYSEIIDKNDKNTDLLFGDAATVTYITESPVLTLGKTLFGTNGGGANGLICEHGAELQMKGRDVFNFTAREVPKQITNCLVANQIEKDEIDCFILHQGSKYIVDTITRRLKLEDNKVPYRIHEYGNTISSSIPLILEQELKQNKHNKYLLSGFGVGLSWASTVLQKVKQ